MKKILSGLILVLLTATFPPLSAASEGAYQITESQIDAMIKLRKVVDVGTIEPRFEEIFQEECHRNGNPNLLTAMAAYYVALGMTNAPIGQKDRSDLKKQWEGEVNRCLNTLTI